MDFGNIWNICYLVGKNNKEKSRASNKTGNNSKKKTYCL